MCFESARLVYERIKQHHAQELADVLCDPQVYEYIDDGVAPTFEQLLKSFESREIGPPDHRRNEIWIDYIARTKDSSVAIGRVEATIIEHRAEIAYILGAPYWRQGYGNESLIRLQDFLKEKYRVKEFWATVTPGNESSKQLLLKNNYVEVAYKNLPRLTSYDQNDWVFCRPSEEN